MTSDSIFFLTACPVTAILTRELFALTFSGMVSDDIKNVLAGFAIEGDLVDCTPYGNGHIHDTYAATYTDGGGSRRFIHQRLNHHVFKDPIGMMRNIVRVCEHLGSKLGSGPQQALEIVKARNGDTLRRDADGYYWRTYVFVENTEYHDFVQSPGQAEAAGFAFARFQGMLVDLDANELNETIPNFHHTPSRMAALESAIAADTAGRVAQCRDEINFALARKETVRIVTDGLESSEIPVRVTHNDTKINNVLLDVETGAGVCVIDLDTVMAGSLLYDFGELVRTSTGDFAENEKDLGKVTLDIERYEALVRGYVGEAKSFLQPREIELLPHAGFLMTFENGIRFLADYLNGDTYYKIHYAEENLDRTHTQFCLVKDIEKKIDQLGAIIDRHI